MFTADKVDEISTRLENILVESATNIMHRIQVLSFKFTVLPDKK
jgi:hypothetical protein